MDLQWSSDSVFLISGSVDNSCLIWDTNKGSPLNLSLYNKFSDQLIYNIFPIKFVHYIDPSTPGSVHQILDSHCHYVQGVAWDPLGKYIASLSSDRTCRIYTNKPQSKTKGSEKINFVSQHVIAKVEKKTADDQKVCDWLHYIIDEI